MESDTVGSRPALPFIVSTLPGWPDVGLLRAAMRAGASGILNLEAVPPTEGRAQVAALRRDQAGRIGIRVDRAAEIEWLGELIDGIDVAIVAAGAWSDTIELIERLRASSRQVLLECVSADDARIGAEIGVDGLIAKGHESGGRVGDETTFVLVQRLLAEGSLPVYAHGGIGAHTIGACFVAGCAGVVLDAQLALARESTLSGAVKHALSRMSGDETVCLGSEIDESYRLYRRPGCAVVRDLQRLEAELADSAASDAEIRHRWHDAVRTRINWSSVGARLWPLGQDAAFAGPLARRFRSVSGILSGLADALVEHVETARNVRPLDRGAPLALAHRTEYPILQGPMTRVSDTAGFAAAVAGAGGLPFLALALLRGPQVRTLLAETKARLGDRSWGVGILGFVPLDLRDEQLRVVQEFAPPFALIAGGRPDQAATLEQQGIPTYLHVPAPSLLEVFLGDGARRFIFEGRECGGHVGPRTSFVLWEAMVDTLVEAIDRGIPASEFHVVFAGGIHDARSAAMVATIAAPLARRGARVGVLMGTAYLFTEEAVATGAIVDGFQEEALKCSRTVLLESGPGHATRCAQTPFQDLFRQTRRQLAQQGENHDSVRLQLERLNLGRLRVASKGITRASEAAAGQGEYIAVDKEQQRADGMYMIGQVAALRSATCQIADLHRAVSVDGSALLGARPVITVSTPAEPPAAAVASNIAIVGIGCLLPHASDARTLWSKILDKTDAIGDIPADRFDAARYYDPDRRARDKIYSKWGGFLPEFPFDPLKFGIPPAALPSIDPFQLLTLAVVDQAIGDAGYSDRPFNRERTSVILGASGGVGDLGFRYGMRAGLPMYFDEVPEETLARLPEWTEDSFAGVLLNVAAGRVANRLNLGGLNFTVDAACASSLAAVYVAARELEAGASDLAIVGGIDTVNSPFGYLCFSSAQALSPTGRCRPFDQSADGIVISEGLVALVLKRVADAERDGDRVYAVIRGVAGSSDGRGKGLTAPRPEGQMRVLERAYAAAGFSPATVGLVEAHGTGTVAGDAAEVAALTAVFGNAGTRPASCALGSIKSMIGHTKSAAGVSGLAKVALSLYHKVLPPTLHVTTPNAKLREPGNPFFVNTEPLPWVGSPDPERPRRAAVSSFGFGGTNFHVVLEEYDRNAPGGLPEAAPADAWPAELACWRSPSAESLLAALQQLDERLSTAPDASLRDVAAAVCRASTTSSGSSFRLAIVASSIADLRTKLAGVCDALTRGETRVSESRGVFLASGSEPAGKIAFLFPGQGSQYPGMLRDLAVFFPDLRQAMEVGDRATELDGRRLSTYVFPAPAFTDDERAQHQRELTDTVVAQPALGAVEVGLSDLLRRLGVRPDMTAGHSYGEYVALSAAGVFPPDVLLALSQARGRAIKTAAGDQPGAMAAVSASACAIAELLAQPADVCVANLNSPRQTVLAGRADAIDAAVASLTAAGLGARRIPVSCAFHSPLVESAARVMSDILARTEVRPPAFPVFSNTLAAAYPADPDDIRRILSDHITAPVRFAEQLQAMYDAGARIFLEVGPRAVLSNLARETLAADRPLILTIDSGERHGVTQLLSVIAQLAAAGVEVDFDELWRGRTIEPIQLARLAPAAPLPRHVWMVSGGRVRRQQDSIAVAAKTSGATVDTGPTHTPSIPPLQDGAMHSESPIQHSQLVLDTASDEVMRQFQQLMSQFLHTQAVVMTTYLQGAPAAGLTPLSTTGVPAPAAMPSRPVQAIRYAAAPVAAVQPAPAAAPAPATLHPVIAHAATPQLTTAVPTASAPLAVVSSPAPGHAPASPPNVLALLLNIVSERTGYPEEMLEVDANLEADLGIDSIKRVEILATFQQVHGGEKRGAFQGAMEKLAAVKTLRETAALLTDLLTAQPEPAVA